MNGRDGRIEAEALAWPFACVDAVRHPSVDVDPGRLATALRALSLGSVPPDHHLEVAARLATEEGGPLWVYLRRIATARLQPGGPVMRLVPDHDAPGRELLDWRWLSLRLPPSLLIAAASPGGTVPPPRVAALDPGLAPTGPVAHLHLHRAGNQDFEAAWLAIGHVHCGKNWMVALPDPPIPDPAPARDARSAWGSLLRRAHLARHVLACSLQRGITATQAAGRHEHLLAPLLTGRLSPDRFEEAEVDRVLRQAARDQPECLRPAGERRWLRATLDHLEAGHADPCFQVLWCQVVRVKCVLYQWLVQSPWEPGLAQFNKVLRRADKLDEREGPEPGELEQSEWMPLPLDLRAVELRGAPPRDDRKMDRYRADLKRIGRDIEACFIVHLIRSPKQPWRERPFLHQHRETCRHAERFCRVLDGPGRPLEWIRGLDLASDELQGPLWLHARTLALVRRRSQALAAEAPAGMLCPLRLTLHVGESFHHLLGGLRAVHEPFIWRLVERGDRLGHATALGIDPVRWYAEHEAVGVPRLDRLLDLIWLQHALRTLHVPATSEAFDTLRSSIEALDKELFGVVPGSSDAREWFLRLGTTTLEPPTGDHRIDLLMEDAPTIERAQELVPIRARLPGEALLVRSVRDALLQHIALWQVAIEVCPTSNLLIAPLDAPLEQPMFHLRPVDPAQHSVVPLTINADDPLQFATDLASEFAFAWASMVHEADKPAGWAQAWLQEAAANSWRHRFSRSG